MKVALSATEVIEMLRPVLEDRFEVLMKQEDYKIKSVTISNNGLTIDFRLRSSPDDEEI